MADIKTIMTADPSGAGLVESAKSTAERLVKDGLTRSQIRNIFTEVRRIEALWDLDQGKALRRLSMLKPKLDYQSARSSQVNYLAEVLGQAIDQVNAAGEPDQQTERFQRFIELFEAILAYHRALGGRN